MYINTLNLLEQSQRFNIEGDTTFRNGKKLSITKINEN